MPQWKGLKIEKPVRDYGPDDVDKHLKKLLRRHAEMVEKDGPINAGDFAIVDVTFNKDGKAVSEMLDESVCVMPTLSFADGKIEGFAKTLEGATAGETKETKAKVSPDAINGIVASVDAVAKQPGWPTCGVSIRPACSGSAQVNASSSPGAPCVVP